MTKTSDNKTIMIMGNPIDGFTYEVYDTYEDAFKSAELSNGDWWLVTADYFPADLVAEMISGNGRES